MKGYEIYCGNHACPTRAAGRLFNVIPLQTDTAGERAAFLRPDATHDNDYIDGIDGLMADGEVWLCPDCATSEVQR